MDEIAEIAKSFDGIIVSLAIIIEIAHYTQVICGIRAEWDEKKRYQQPFATWFMSLACCFGGGIIIHLVIGKPALTPLANTQSLMLMTIVWWHIFYSPKDAIYSFVTVKPIALVVSFLKEMIRTRKIIKGVKLSYAVYPQSLFVCTVLGMVGACGGGFVKNAAIMLRSEWTVNSVKNFSFSVVTKFCLVFSLLYNLQIRSILPVTFETVVLAQFVVMFLYAASAKFGVASDPFHPLEAAITGLVVDYSAFVGPVATKEVPKKEEKAPKKSKSKSKKDD